MSNLIRSKTALHKEGAWINPETSEERVLFGTEGIDTVVTISGAKFAALGSPDEITVTVEPGNTIPQGGSTPRGAI